MVTVDGDDQIDFICTHTGHDRATVQAVMDLKDEYMMGVGLIEATDAEWLYYEPAELVGEDQEIDTERLAADAEKRAGVPWSVALDILDSELYYLRLQGLVDDSALTAPEASSDAPAVDQVIGLVTTTPLTVAQKRAIFASDRADGLAIAVGVDPATRLAAAASRTKHFVWYSDASALTLVVGEQEDSSTDLALAVGLGERGDRRLRLVLPRGWHEPTLHRWAWLADLPLEVWSHDWLHDADGARPGRELCPTREVTQQLVRGEEKPQLHLGDRTAWIEPLLRWAAKHPDLDASHRPDVRAWQCRGQRVLRIRRTHDGLVVVAGIDWGANAKQPSPVPRHVTGPLTAAEVTSIRGDVESGMKQRLDAHGPAHRPDEHWLQSVLRRHPRSLGLEHPVLREVAAWRPRGSLRHTKDRQGRHTGTTPVRPPRGRGFVDLAGLDASGDVLIVETKLGADHMLVLQGLDYKIWAEANRERITSRLDCRHDVPFEISYCVGGTTGGDPTWSQHTAAQLAALAPDIPWHVQEVRDWIGDGANVLRGAVRTFPLTTTAVTT